MSRTADPKPREAGLRLNGSRKGEIGKAVEVELVKAREAGRAPLDEFVVVALRRMAGVADAAWRVNDARLFMAAMQRVDALRVRLGLVEASTAGGGESDGDDDRPADGGDAVDRELERILGSGPALRHTKDS